MAFLDSQRIRTHLPGGQRSSQQAFTPAGAPTACPLSGTALSLRPFLCPHQAHRGLLLGSSLCCFPWALPPFSQPLGPDLLKSSHRAFGPSGAIHPLSNLALPTAIHGHSDPTVPRVYLFDLSPSSWSSAPSPLKSVNSTPSCRDVLSPALRLLFLALLSPLDVEVGRSAWFLANRGAGDRSVLHTQGGRLPPLPLDPESPDENPLLPW